MLRRRDRFKREYAQPMNAIRQEMSAESTPSRHSIASSIAPIACHLRIHDYSFTAVTPETHRRVVANNADCSDVLRDTFGWNRSFARDEVAAPVFDALESASALQRVDHSNSLWRSRIRFATLGEDIFAHSAFPTDAADSVFFGPDTYRFRGADPARRCRAPPSGRSHRRHRLRQRRGRDHCGEGIEGRRTHCIGGHQASGARVRGGECGSRGNRALRVRSKRRILVDHGCD